MRRAASQADKENRDLMNPLIHKKKSRIERSRILNDRDARRMIRYVIKNKVNRRKPWVQIAREYEYTAKSITIDNCFKLHNYGRYLSRFKSSLSSEMKAQRLTFSEK